MHLKAHKCVQQCICFPLFSCSFNDQFRQNSHRFVIYAYFGIHQVTININYQWQTYIASNREICSCALRENTVKVQYFICSTCRLTKQWVKNSLWILVVDNYYQRCIVPINNPNQTQTIQGSVEHKKGESDVIIEGDNAVWAWSHLYSSWRTNPLRTKQQPSCKTAPAKMLYKPVTNTEIYSQMTQS